MTTPQNAKMLKIMESMEKRMVDLERQVAELTGRMDRMYKGWGDTKSDLAKLKIRLVQRDDLQKVLKEGKEARADAVQQRFKQTIPYFTRKYGGKGPSKLGETKKHLHKTVGHDLIKQPGERNRIMKWIDNSAKSKRPDDYMRSPATSIGSLKKNEVFMKTFKPIRVTREQNSASWASGPSRSTSYRETKRSLTPASSTKSVTSRRRQG